MNFKKLRIITTKDSKNQKICLRKKSEYVENINDDILSIINRMIDLKGFIGCGIACPQIGVNLNIIVVDNDDEKNIVLINPIFTPIGTDTNEAIEGCLSVPRQKFLVKRYNKIFVNAIDINGKKISIEASGFFARVIQHECDHLNGTMICDIGKQVS